MNFMIINSFFIKIHFIFSIVASGGRRDSFKIPRTLIRPLVFNEIYVLAEISSQHVFSLGTTAENELCSIEVINRNAVLACCLSHE